MTDNAAAAAAIAAAPTRVVYAETIANPTTVVTDHATVARLAHEHGATYIVDNTFASPYICRPLELGADLVVESATKFLSGHSDVIAGVVAGRADLMRQVQKVQIDTGATIGPFDAFLVLRGIMTLAVRVERHAPNGGGTRGLAGASGRRAAASSIPVSRATPSTTRPCASSVPASRAGCSRSRSAGGREAGRAIIDALTLTELTASLGSVHTMVVHPPSTSQRQLPTPSSPAPASPRACCGSRSGSRTSRTCRPTSRPRSRSRGRDRSGRAARRRRLGTSHRGDTGRCSRGPGRRLADEPAGPARAGAVAAPDVGRLRGRPDHLPVDPRGHRDDPPAAARLRVPLARRLRHGDGRDPCPL